jgi:metal-responsive CopG/Arc/MetJ family transcriptional regulator
MPKTSYDNIRPVRKRGAVTGSLIGVRLQPELLDAVDAWIAKQAPPPPTRPEAIRAMVAAFLKLK